MAARLEGKKDLAEVYPLLLSFVYFGSLTSLRKIPFGSPISVSPASDFMAKKQWLFPAFLRPRSSGIPQLIGLLNGCDLKGEFSLRSGVPGSPRKSGSPGPCAVCKAYEKRRGSANLNRCYGIFVYIYNVIINII